VGILSDKEFAYLITFFPFLGNHRHIESASDATGGLQQHWLTDGLFLTNHLISGSTLDAKAS
jgi:hypothetical protein